MDELALQHARNVAEESEEGYLIERLCKAVERKKALVDKVTDILVNSEGRTAEDQLSEIKTALG